jgi:hypothetical protein
VNSSASIVVPLAAFVQALQVTHDGVTTIGAINAMNAASSKQAVAGTAYVSLNGGNVITQTWPTTLSASSTVPPSTGRRLQQELNSTWALDGDCNGDGTLNSADANQVYNIGAYWEGWWAHRVQRMTSSPRRPFSPAPSFLAPQWPTWRPSRRA